MNRMEQLNRQLLFQRSIQHRPGTRAQRNRAVALWAMVVVVLLVATGCSAIPMHGSVGKSDPLAPRNNSVNVSLQQFSPVDGAAPESIIRGFIDSGTGISDDFQVARQYLTPALAQSWAPDKRTLVYQDTFAVAPAAQSGVFDLTFNAVSSVDATGVLTPAKAESTEMLSMKLVQVDGQWRISEVPDGVVIAEANFQTLYAPVSLFFYDPTFTYGVPDVRWLAGRTSRTATSIVKAILQGPAPYLQGAVVSAFPSGMALDRDSVPVNNGQAKVGLTAQQLLATSIEQRQQMNAQLLTTFQKSLNTITEVQFLADDRSVDMGGTGDDVSHMIVDNPVPPTQIALAQGDLVTFDGTKIGPIPGVSPVANLEPSAPAISYSGKNFAFLSGVGNQIFTVQANEAPLLTLAGVALTPPSFAPNGWLWSAAGDGSGLVMAIDPDDGGKLGTPVLLTVPWLVGQQVHTFRVSRDGTRALVISEANGVSKVSITGIFKTGELPKELTAPIRLLHSGTPSLGVWAGDSSVAVMNPSATEPVVIEVLDLAVPAVQMDELKGVQWLSAGSGVRNVHAQTASEFYTNAGNYWEVDAKELQQASFAG